MNAMKSCTRFPSVVFIALLCSASINPSLAVRHLVGPTIPPPSLFPPLLPPLPGFFPAGAIPWLPAAGLPIGPIGFPFAPGLLGGPPLPPLPVFSGGVPGIGFTATPNEIPPPLPADGAPGADQPAPNSVPIVPPN